MSDSSSGEIKYITPKPPDFLFKKENTGYILNEFSPLYLMTGKVEAIEHQGIFVHYVGTPYCRKGFVTPEILFALNQMKKIILEGLKILKNPLFLIAFLCYDKNKLVQSLNVVLSKIFSQYVIKDEYMCRASFGLANFAHSVLLSFKVDNSLAKELAFIVAQIIEFDDAYRYRFQDIVSEINFVEFKKNPRKEIKRLFAMFCERSLNNVPKKLEHLVSLVVLLLLIPKVKKAFIQSVDFLKDCRYDKHDRYWACIRADHYNFFGMTIEQREKLYTERPTQINAMA